jgi:hypothetical protein
LPHAATFYSDLLLERSRCPPEPVMIGAWLRTQPSSAVVMIALASGLACTRGLGGLSAGKGATVPTVSVPALPLPAFAQAAEAAGELDQFATSIRELDGQLDEEATRTLLEFARALRLVSVRFMTNATTIEEVAVRLSDYGREN